MSDEQQCETPDINNNDPLLPDLMHALMQQPMIVGVPVETGGRRLVMALRGRIVRQHFDEKHPDQLDRGAEMAPPDEDDREAWLFGFRFEGRAG